MNLMHQLLFARRLVALLHLVDILQVEPGVERSNGEVQVWQLELCDARADVSLVSVDAECGEAQAVLVQRRQVQRDGEALVKDHCERIHLDLGQRNESVRHWKTWMVL